MVSKKVPIKLPNRALTNIELEKFVGRLRIPNFRGVYMRNNLPKHINVNETGIINLDDKNGPGTHWTAYLKRGPKIIYFDSMGKLKPPIEAIRYFKSDGKGNCVKYNHDRFQQFNTYNCGKLVLEFLYLNTKL